MALHLDRCLKPDCKNVNEYKQKCQPDLQRWDACLAEIYALTWWYGPELKDAKLEVKPTKLQDMQTKNIKPLDYPQPCLAEAKPKFEPKSEVNPEPLPAAMPVIRE